MWASTVINYCTYSISQTIRFKDGSSWGEFTKRTLKAKEEDEADGRFHFFRPRKLLTDQKRRWNWSWAHGFRYKLDYVFTLKGFSNGTNRISSKWWDKLKGNYQYSNFYIDWDRWTSNTKLKSNIMAWDQPSYLENPNRSDRTSSSDEKKIDSQIRCRWYFHRENKNNASNGPRALPIFHQFIQRDCSIKVLGPKTESWTSQCLPSYWRWFKVKWEASTVLWHFSSFSSRKIGSSD